MPRITRLGNLEFDMSNNCNTVFLSPCGGWAWLKAAFAYVAVTLNLFGEDLYHRRGGRGKVKEGFE